MKRFKKHKVKEEKPEPSNSREIEEHDLAYYIHDRVELMHQVFSVLKAKDLKAMAPECIRNLSNDDLQELCTEELLGISSKRLLSILDAAPAPSDTESSSASPERLETISLDSISSEEMMSEGSRKKKHKHKKHSKSKKKKTASPESERSASIASIKDGRGNKSGSIKDGRANKSKAARAGLTVLELLELQARARAIRAQLHQEQARQASNTEPAVSGQQISSGDEDAVQIKEEPALIVEISSDEEKPKLAELEACLKNTATSSANKQTESQQKQSSNTQENTTTKRVKDLIITVPQTKSTRKIKLKRNKSVVENTQENNKSGEANKSQDSSNSKDKDNQVANDANKLEKKKNAETKKIKRVKKKKQKDKDGSDQDEIMLQLSDTEKMDLLEDFEGKKDDSSSSEDSEDSSESSDSESEPTGSSNKDSITISKQNEDKEAPNVIEKGSGAETLAKDSETVETPAKIVNKDQVLEEVKVELSNIELTANIDDAATEEQKDKSVDEIELNIETQLNINTDNSNKDETVTSNVEPMEVDEVLSEKNIEITCVNDLPVKEDVPVDDEVKVSNESEPNTFYVKQLSTTNNDKNTQNNDSESDAPDKTLQIVVQGNSRRVQAKVAEAGLKSTVTVVNESSSKDNIGSESTTKEKQTSEGELTDAESSEIEAVDLKPEVVCISDDENKKAKSHKKKNKKKEKKSKKEKKKKSKSDFREASDQNFFTENSVVIEIVDKDDISSNIIEDNTKNDNPNTIKSRSEPSSPITINDDDIYEILELSDDSSCFEVEGVSVLSKEPTAEEIEALSAKIDEFQRDDVITDEQIQQHEKTIKEKQNEDDLENIEHISWKDRYLGSKKVKRVLTTSNILNAMRKKNKELKLKLEQSKVELQEKNDTELKEHDKVITEEITKNLEEGSIEHYNTLIGSTKYVNPVPEKVAETQNGEVTDDAEVSNKTNEPEREITREMKKDAKQLLKMYKRLLKYNDITKQRDPNKKKKKKNKKNKEKTESKVTS